MGDPAPLAREAERAPERQTPPPTQSRGPYPVFGPTEAPASPQDTVFPGSSHAAEPPGSAFSDAPGTAAPANDRGGGGAIPLAEEGEQAPRLFTPAETDLATDEATDAAGGVCEIGPEDAADVADSVCEPDEEEADAAASALGQALEGELAPNEDGDDTGSQGNPGEEGAQPGEGETSGEEGDEGGQTGEAEGEVSEAEGEESAEGGGEDGGTDAAGFCTAEFDPALLTSMVLDTGHIPLDANNSAALAGEVQARASALRDTITCAAAAAHQSAQERATTYRETIDTAAYAAVEEFYQSADATIASINAETSARIAEAEALQLISESQFDAMIDAALADFEASYTEASDGVGEAIEAKASAIVSYGNARAAAIREGVQTRIDRARTLKQEAFVPYVAHDDRDDVLEALNTVYNEAVTRFRDGAEDTASEIEAFAREAAATWRRDVPPNNAELNELWHRSTEALEVERSRLKAELSSRTAELVDGFNEAANAAILEVETAAYEFAVAVEDARVQAHIEIDDAVTGHCAAIDTAAAETTVQVDTLEAAMLAEIATLQSETCGLFNPAEATPALEYGFGAIDQEWNGRAALAEEQFTAATEAASETFAATVESARATGTTVLESEMDNFAVTSTTFIGEVAQLQAEAVAAGQAQVDIVVALVNSDLVATAATITNALDAAYDEAAGSIDQTEFGFNADHNGALYELRDAYSSAITEALKAWYESLWDWLTDIVSAFFSALADFVVWIGKTIVNIVWGFIWGEAWFPEAWGAGAIAFVFDVVAGVLVYGDVRDLFKWGIYKPFIKGEEWTWLNTLMIGLSLVGLIPAYGDIIKVLGKGGVKVLVKELGERVARELFEEFAEHGGAEVVERLVRDLGAETVKGLTEKVGAQGLRELVGEFGERGLKDLVDEIGADAVGRLAAEFGAAELKAAVDSFTAAVLRDLASELGEATLKQVVDELGEAVTKDLVAGLGAQGLKDLTDTFGVAGLKTLLDGATGITARTLADLTQEFGATAVKELIDEIGAPAIREITETLSASGLKQLADEFSVAGLKTLLDASTGLAPRLVGQLADELGAAGLKQVADDLGLPVLRELADDAAGIGVSSIGTLFRGMGRVDFSRLIGRLGVGGARQLTSDLGADRLARVIATGGYDDFAAIIGRTSDPLAIAGRAVPYAARLLDEAFDIVRHAGANTATLRIGRSGFTESGEATLSQVSSGLSRSSAEGTAQGVAARAAGDEGGHIFGHRFMTEQNLVNMFSQAANFNKGAYKKLENEVAAWISNGATVRMSVELIGASGGRPSAVRVVYDAYTAAGTHIFRQATDFLNQAGQNYSRLSSREIARRVAATTP